MEENSSQSQEKSINSSSELENKNNIPQELEELIKYIPADKKREAIKLISSLSVHTESSFKGPLPPPSILGDYNNIIKDGAERIMRMAEIQSAHRIELEKHAIKEELKQSGRGQKFGFILAILGFLVAFGLAYLGHDTVAGIFGTTTGHL